MEKDYSLLRPFDLEAAKRGDAICRKDDGESRSFITGPDKHGYFVVESADGYYRFGKSSEYRMTPLCWVRVSADDDTLRPVYKGDVLWHTARGAKVIADKVSSNGSLIEPGCQAGDYLSNLTWTPPKVKREGWVNVYRSGVLPVSAVNIYPTKEVADALQGPDRIACVRIEWEE